MKLYVNIKKKLHCFEMHYHFSKEFDSLGILGESGAGKSMLLRCIMGIEKPDSGCIILNDIVLFDSEKKINLAPFERNIGYLFQSYALFPHMTVEENIVAGLMYAKDKEHVRYSYRERKKRKLENLKEVYKMIKEFGLEGLEHKYPDTLSGGQQQRVACARMLINKPSLVLLDEPFSALDEGIKDQMQYEMLKIMEQHSGGFILVSHSRNDIYKFSKELLVISNGAILMEGSTKNIFSSPKFVKVAKLTGCKNISRIEKRSEHCVYVPDWDIEVTLDEVISDHIDYIAIRAHDILINPKEEKEKDMEVTIVREMILPFEIQYLLSNKNSKKETKLWCQRNKETENEVPQTIRFRQDAFMLLKDKGV